MEHKLENKSDVIPLVKRIYWLAWLACFGTQGAGFLQDRPGATEDEVWNNILNYGDYAGNPNLKPGKVYGDYVFGRMMKLGVEFNEAKKTVTVPDRETAIDYQGWSGQYPTYKALLEAAIADPALPHSIPLA